MVSELEKKAASQALYKRLENALGNLQSTFDAMEAKTPQNGSTTLTIKRLEEVAVADDRVVFQMSSRNAANEEEKRSLRIVADVKTKEAQAFLKIDAGDRSKNTTDNQETRSKSLELIQKDKEEAKRAATSPTEPKRTSLTIPLEEYLLHASNIATVGLFDKLSKQGYRFERQREPVDKKFAAEVERDPGKFVSDYRKEFGNHLCTDNALNLCQEYREGTLKEKARYAPLIAKTASSIVKGVYDEMLKEPAPDGKYNTAAFVSGGMASGKSTEIARLKEQHHIVYEVVKGLSEEKIEKAFDHGKKVAVFHIHRPIEQATVSLIPRSEKEGRTPSLKFFAKGHYESQNILFQRLEKYGDRDNFGIEVIDNSRFNEPSRLSSVEFLSNNAYRSIEEVEKRAKGELENVHRTRKEQGKPIPEFITAKLKREELERDYGRISSTDDRGRSGSSTERGRDSQTGGEISHTVHIRNSEGDERSKGDRGSDRAGQKSDRVSERGRHNRLDSDTEKSPQTSQQHSHQRKRDDRER